MDTIKLDAAIKNVDEVTDFVDARLEKAGCPVRTMMQINIVIDEIFSNIAKFAYAPGTGPAEVSVEVTEEPREVWIVFADRGVPYDPLSSKEPDITLGVDERPIGGLGIFIVKKTMDEVIYRYCDGKNTLRIGKKLEDIT